MSIETARIDAFCSSVSPTFPRPALPNRTCEFPRIRLSTISFSRGCGVCLRLLAHGDPGAPVSVAGDRYRTGVEQVLHCPPSAGDAGLPRARRPAPPGAGFTPKWRSPQIHPQMTRGVPVKRPLGVGTVVKAMMVANANANATAQKPKLLRPACEAGWLVVLVIVRWRGACGCATWNEKRLPISQRVRTYPSTREVAPRIRSRRVGNPYTGQHSRFSLPKT